MKRKLYASKVKPGAHKALGGMGNVDKIIEIDQSPIGRTPRSNPATYTGVFDEIRKLFTQTREAKLRRLQARSVQLQRQGRPVRVMPGPGRQAHRDALPARRLRRVRGVQGQAIQPRDADRPLPRQDDRRRARHDDRGREVVLREHPADLPDDKGAGGRRPRLRQARPALHAAFRRRGPTRQARQRARQEPRPATRSTSSTSRPPACTSRTSASSSTCSSGSATSATRCW